MLEQSLALDNGSVLCCFSQGRDSNVKSLFLKNCSISYEAWKQERKRNEYCHSLRFSGIIAINRWHWRKNNDQIRDMLFQILGQIPFLSLMSKITLEVGPLNSVGLGGGGSSSVGLGRAQWMLKGMLELRGFLPGDGTGWQD